jgi:NitT/TauT family transport system substrate-binding protein
MRYYLRNITVILIILFLTSCLNKPANTIRIGILNGPSAVSFIQMIDKPPFIGGKKVEFVIKNEPMQIQALMMQQKIDFAILPTVMAANLYNKGLNYRMVSCPIWGTLYLLTNTNQCIFEQLKGKTISVFGQGATPDILLRHLLIQNQVSDLKLDYSYSTNSEIGQALLSRKAKFAVVSEPLVSILLNKDKAIKIIHKLDCEEFLENSDQDIFVQTSFLVSDRFSKDNKSLVNQVSEAYFRSCNFTSEQPDQTANLMVKHAISPNVSLAKLSLPLCNIRYVGAFAIEKEIQKYLTIFYEFNPLSIGGKMPDKDFIYQNY